MKGEGMEDKTRNSTRWKTKELLTGVRKKCMIIHWRLPSYICTRLGRTLILVAIIISLILFLSFSHSDQSSASLEREISRLSVYYVRALARERGMQNVKGSADLQKTMPVLLRSLILRLNNLESSVGGNWTANGGYASLGDSRSAGRPLSQLEEVVIKEESERFTKFCKVNVIRDALLRSKGQCQLPPDFSATHPECQGKQDWISKFRDSHRCYSDHGVDASSCSAIFYLSEIESFCPRSRDFKPSMTDIKPVITELNLILAHAPLAIRERVERYWPEWAKASTKVSQTQQQRMALYIGKREKLSYMETVMWADLAAGLHALGHSIVWIHSRQRLEQLLSKLPPLQPDVPCPSRPTTFLNVLYTDKPGREAIESILGRSLTQMACILRILSPQGEIPNRGLPPTGMVWGQYLTAYPLMDDHTFLGFAVAIQAVQGDPKTAVVLGASYEDFSKAGPYLQAISKRFPIHTAIPDVAVAERVSRLLSPYVSITNTVGTLDSLLPSAAVLVGLGHPLNDPFVLEAIGRGVKFINPILPNPAHLSNVSEQWIQNSQHSYLEQSNPAALLVNPLKPKMVADQIWTLPSESAVLPNEFTHSGYLERLARFLRYRDYCIPTDQWNPLWPPLKSIEYFLGVQGDSCQLTCMKRARKCEPSYFSAINMRSELEERGIPCSAVFFRSNPLYPAVDSANKACHFQSESRHYSCFHSPVSSTLQRICPCRDVMKTQSALCVAC